MSQHKYPLRRDPKQTFAGDDWEIVQNKKAGKNSKKTGKNGTSTARNETGQSNPNRNKPSPARNQGAAGRDDLSNLTVQDSEENIGEVVRNSFPCRGCEVIVQSKQSLLHHEAACPALKVDVSKPHPFSDRNQNTDQQQTDQDTEKDIVLTQPLGPYNHREDNVSYAAVVNSPAPGNPTPAILVNY